MLRLMITLLALLLTPAATFAAEACDGLTVPALLGQVPYFSKRMDVVGSPNPGEVRLVHKDDPSLSGSFEVVQTDPIAPMTRSTYLAIVDADLERRVRQIESMGLAAEQAVYPYDPIAWTVVTRGDSVEVSGLTMIRLAPTCSLEVNWLLPETLTMASRNAEFQAAMDALRALSEQYVVRDEFLEERLLPKPWQALGIGFLAPMIAALALAYVLKHMIFLSSPGPLSRGAAGVVVAAGALGLYAQHALYFANLETFTFMDNAVLILAVMLSSGYAVITGSAKAVLAGLSVSIVAGMSLAVCSGLNWAPDPSASMILAIVFVALGVSGLLHWQVAATTAIRRRTVKSA